MPKQVDVEGVGLLEFPDDASVEEIGQVLNSQFRPPATERHQQIASELEKVRSEDKVGRFFSDLLTPTVASKHEEYLRSQTEPTSEPGVLRAGPPGNEILAQKVKQFLFGPTTENERRLLEVQSPSPIQEHGLIGELHQGLKLPAMPQMPLDQQMSPYNTEFGDMSVPFNALVKPAIEGLSSPLGFAAPISFVPSMVVHTPESAREAGRLSVEGTPQQSAEANIGLIGQIATPGLSFLHLGETKPELRFGTGEPYYAREIRSNQGVTPQTQEQARQADLRQREGVEETRSNDLQRNPPSGDTGVEQPRGVEPDVEAGKAEYAKIKEQYQEFAKRGDYESPEFMAVAQKLEDLKNRFGGAVPGKEMSGESGFGADWLLQGVKAILEKTGFKKETPIGGEQMLNRLRNLSQKGELPTGELAAADAAGLREFLQTPRSGEEMAKWWEANVQKPETVVYGMEGKVSEARREYDRMTHEWLDEQPQNTRARIQSIFNHHDAGDILAEERIKGDLVANYNVNQLDLEKYINLRDKTIDEPPNTSPRATPTYDTVSALPTNEPMPEWTTSKEGKNVQRVDVVIPTTKPWAVDRSKSGELWEADNLHENLPNTLGWAMIQYKTGPKGEKIAFVAEAQSRWGQTAREQGKYVVKQNADGKYYAEWPDGHTSPWYETKTMLENSIKRGDRVNRSGLAPDHPLLRDYNRLILKAAVEQARKEGATHIVVSDAETAMMTEGHDLDTEWKVNHTSPETGKKVSHGFRNEADAVNLVKRLEQAGISDAVITHAPVQAPGMRLNYDETYWTLKDEKGNLIKDAGIYKTREDALANTKEGQSPVEKQGMLPKIVEELTGSKGEKVNLGKHKNAYNSGIAQRVMHPDDAKQPRPNLIFHEPTGEPKTTASGVMYKIPERTEPFSVYGKDVFKPLKETQPSQGFGPESGAVNLQPLKETFDKVRAFVKSGGPKERMSQLLDAADNQAKIVGRQEGNDIRTLLDEKIARNALTFVIEAGGDKKALDDFSAKVSGKNSVASAAIAYAKVNWNRLEQIAQRAVGIMDKQRDLERSKGVETDHVENYIKHAYEFDKNVLFDGGPGGTGVASSFKKQRIYPTYADAIADGLKPKTLDAADLIESRVAAGMKMVNRIEWGESLGQLKDPTDNEPLVKGLVKQPKGTLVAPKGYGAREILPGVRIAVKDEYSGIFDALLGDSDIRRSALGRGVLKAESVIKHGLLLFDSFHASRVLQKQFFLTGKAGFKKSLYQKGLSVLEYNRDTVERLVSQGDLPESVLNWYKTNKSTADLLVKNGLNVGRLSEALYSEVIRRELPLFGIDVNIPGRFNRWVFEKVSRSAMMESALVEYTRTKKNNPSWTEEQVASHVAKQINIYFGNLMRQGLFKSNTKRDILQATLLAPQWFESMIQTELRAYGQAAKVPLDAAFERTLKVGTLAKGVGTGLFAYLVGTQLLNQFTRKQFTWQNDEKDHKLDAWIPDPTGKTGGYWISPFSVAAEVTHDWIRYSQVKKNQLAVIAQILKNKASPLERAAQTLLTQRDFSGTKLLSTEEVLKQSGKSLLPVPLPVSGATSELPGQTGRQLIGSLGLKVEPASTRKFQLDEASMKRFGEKFDNLTIGQKAVILKTTEKEPTSLQQRYAIAQKATEHEFERQESLLSKLPSDVQKFVSDNKLTISAPEPSLSKHKISIPFSEEQQSLLEEKSVKWYGVYLKPLMQSASFKALNQSQKQKVVNERLTQARDRARKETIAESQRRRESK